MERERGREIERETEIGGEERKGWMEIGKEAV